MISLINDTINKSDMDDLADWIRTYPRLTKGELTKEFEHRFAEWLGCTYGVFVNSGSSANLIMIYALKMANLLKNNKIAVPSLCWVTDVSPVMQLGLEPIICDCNLENLSVDLNRLEHIFKTRNPSAFLLVSILGFSPEMNEIIRLCNQHGVILVEDNCESLGSMFEDKKLGNFGAMSITSMYFGHHISTIEGGMVFTSDKHLYNILLSLRSHGWNRDWSAEDRNDIENACGVSGINALYTFYYPGFNVRATDLQAFIGLNQLKKLDTIVQLRNRNYKTYMENLNNSVWKPKEVINSFTSNFAYPVISPHKDKIVNVLKFNNVEVRPLVCGSMGNQPFYRQRFGIEKMVNCDIVDRDGIYLPNHPSLTEDDIKFVCSVINDAVKGE